MFPLLGRLLAQATVYNTDVNRTKEWKALKEDKTA